MKNSKAPLFVISVSLFLVSFVLSSTIQPLALKLPTPYAFLSSTYFIQYPFTFAIILIRALSFFLFLLFIVSLFSRHYLTKIIFLLIIGIFSQLYSLQQLISGTTLIPFEWAISLSITGAFLLIPIVIYIIQGTVHNIGVNLKKKSVSLDSSKSDN